MHALANIQHENDNRTNVRTLLVSLFRAGELVQEAVHLISSRNMAEQVAKMEIKVDLQCRRCCKKIKKILCEIPQVKDQIFDEKQKKVTITVVSCSPENVRQKILCKGRCFVQGVEILREKKGDDDQKGKKKKEDDAGGSKGGKVETPSTKKTDPPPPAPADPPVYVMGWVCVCPPCLNRGCGSSCPCSCHCGWPPMCVDGCGRPAHECRCGRPPMCHDGCGRPAHECRCRRPPLCRDGCGMPAHECRCRRPPLCRDGCGMPAHECRCRSPSYPRCCDRCNNENACSSWTPHGCDCGRPPVCTNAGYECESSCSLM
ncbi:uncharacterized protein LOC115665641 [Syzygium oleosum]|uniref:uncharacterized protein LOC115665641 n=1 Tax=Syzygium oleosum TaxID=219896 RepID=UPI0024B902CF|nr:uncharacterized protein LOC115665641 [Syzygium oleosum]